MKLSEFPAATFTEGLLKGEDVTQELTDVTYLYSDLVGYTNMSSNLKPKEIMILLNRLYCRFEKHLSQRGVYKLDAVGDAFIVIGGLDRDVKNFNHCDEVRLMVRNKAFPFPLTFFNVHHPIFSFPDCTLRH